MKKLLILIVAFAVFLHFYPQPELENWYNEQVSILKGDLNSSTDTKLRLKSDKIFIDLKPELASFSPEEVTLLKEISASREAVNEFNNGYCKTSKRHYTLHPANQSKICNTIAKYGNLL